MRTVDMAEYKDLIDYAENGWTPVWVALDEDNDHAEGYPVLIIEWACLWRLGDGKFFRTETVLSSRQILDIIPHLLKNREKETLEFNTSLNKIVNELTPTDLKTKE